MIDNSGQASAEFILLFGGIMVVILLAIYIYKSYVSDLSDELKSNEVSQLNGKLDDISNLFS